MPYYRRMRRTYRRRPYVYRPLRYRGRHVGTRLKTICISQYPSQVSLTGAIGTLDSAVDFKCVTPLDNFPMPIQSDETIKKNLEFYLHNYGKVRLLSVVVVLTTPDYWGYHVEIADNVEEKDRFKYPKYLHAKYTLQKDIPDKSLNFKSYHVHDITQQYRLQYFWDNRYSIEDWKVTLKPDHFITPGTSTCSREKTRILSKRTKLKVVYRPKSLAASDISVLTHNYADCYSFLKSFNPTKVPPLLYLRMEPCQHVAEDHNVFDARVFTCNVKYYFNFKFSGKMTLVE